MLNCGSFAVKHSNEVNQRDFTLIATNHVNGVDIWANALITRIHNNNSKGKGKGKGKSKSKSKGKDSQ